MPKGRPGGNPELEKYQFEQQYDWNESCTEILAFRIPPSMKTAIKEGKAKGWQEAARQAISKLLETNEAKH